MRTYKQLLILLLALSSTAPSGSRKDKASAIFPDRSVSVIWREPQDITMRNVFYGPGDYKDEPHGTFRFIEEDHKGTSPKIIVHDDSGGKWTVKLGPEARPETAATRLVWAIGYFANEDYFMENLRVEGLPSRLSRGQKWVSADGALRNVRLKRHLKHEKKIGTWEWRDNPFTGTRELNGLRVLMAVLNNWDLTDENNAIYQLDGATAEYIYMVSDLGSTFGTGNLTWPMGKTRGNLQTYSHSKFSTGITPDYVNFDSPARPGFFSYLLLANTSISFTYDGLLSRFRGVTRSGSETCWEDSRPARSATLSARRGILLRKWKVSRL